MNGGVVDLDWFDIRLTDGLLLVDGSIDGKEYE